jgi:thioredoxin reductase (NADPH)
MAGEAHTAAATEPIETDAVVIGAGPIGLYQVFQLGLQEIRTHVVDALPHPGGQPLELYPDKPIYDIPAIQVCTGRELVASLLRQIEPMDAHFHLGQKVSQVERRPDGRFLITTDRGTRLIAPTLFIAAGVGAFEPRRLKLPALVPHEGRQVFHQAHDTAELANQHVVIVGGDDVALEWAIRLSRPGPAQPASVTLVHRRDAFQADPDTVAQVRALITGQALRFEAGQITGAVDSPDGLSAVEITSPDGSIHALPLGCLLVFLGLSPRLGTIADWGLAMERKQLLVDTEKFSTSVAGIFAVGDINTYPGKKKLIVCGFHECTLAAFAAAPLVHPERQVMLQYTTTSTRLHELLGVAVPRGSE